MKDARIYDGDYVYIKRCDLVENGKIGVCIVDGEATLKRIYYYPEEERLILIPENKAYAPRSFVGEELSSVHILGQAVAFTSFI
jgi:repressor LexA